MTDMTPEQLRCWAIEQTARFIPDTINPKDVTDMAQAILCFVSEEQSTANRKETRAMTP